MTLLPVQGLTRPPLINPFFSILHSTHNTYIYKNNNQNKPKPNETIEMITRKRFSKMSYLKVRPTPPPHRGTANLEGCGLSPFFLAFLSHNPVHQRPSTQHILSSITTNNIKHPSTALLIQHSSLSFQPCHLTLKTMSEFLSMFVYY